LERAIHDSSWSFGSSHKLVCQFAFADGSVQQVSKGIDPGLLTLLVEINDGQQVDPLSY
jgi:prepilin-type processing-associated H-X9-DG protein